MTRPRRRPGLLPVEGWWKVVAVAIVAFAGAIAWSGTGYGYRPYADEPARLSGQVPAGDRDLKQFVGRLDRRSRDLAARLKATAPRGVYIVIDQTQNRLYLKKDDETLLDARCSAGSGMVLKESYGKKREWVFDSPRGRFQVLSLLRNPVWAKPDWAFVEDGEPIPTRSADRLETGSLGEYALYFGNGFMIHGTLYERLLGRAVSHGCIRVGRDDLRKVWANARLGMHIYIY
jgi:L,D-transpeptidase ErfK/SrfK